MGAAIETTVTDQDRAFVVALDDPAAVAVGLTGGKAANLARAAVAGLDTLPGVVLTTAFSDAVDNGADLRTHPALREAFDDAKGDARSLVARSSSVVEDTADSSMAGQFESVIGIEGFDAFVAAVDEVLASRQRAGAADEPIAVLVQPLIEPASGGVMFGIDPVTGRADRRLISAIEGGPDPLVSGEVDGSRYLVDDRATILEFERNDGAELTATDIRGLVTLSDRVAAVFGAPQDVEWAIAEDGHLWLLQSRHVTTEIRGVPAGPIYGPGPVAETFPEPLTELESDLWVPPLREAVAEAVRLAGTATPAELQASEIVVVVKGHVAIDLRLAGELVPRITLLQRLNPVPGARRLRGSWRVGRLRAALPGLAEHLVQRVDEDLQGVPTLDGLTGRQLFALIKRSRTVLRSLHAHEILMGMLTKTGDNRMTGASVALRILVEARRDGVSDSEIVLRSPAVLALTPPRISPCLKLPAEASAIDLGGNGQNANDNGILREALRLRVRWLQELSGRAAWTLGERLTASGELDRPELIRHITLDHLEAVATKRAVVIPALVNTHEAGFGPPLPASFQLSDRGRPIRTQCFQEVGGGTGAGGGVARGPVTYDADAPPSGSVLVTTTLTPGLAPLLGRLEGIVAETGSVLSHLAILAREAGVATVVGYSGALDDLPEGVMVTVNGDTGQVTVQDEETTS
jgi:phosphohistidine swiveling domain-containing protein